MHSDPVAVLQHAVQSVCGFRSLPDASGRDFSPDDFVNPVTSGTIGRFSSCRQMKILFFFFPSPDDDCGRTFRTPWKKKKKNVFPEEYDANGPRSAGLPAAVEVFEGGVVEGVVGRVGKALIVCRRSRRRPHSSFLVSTHRTPAPRTFSFIRSAVFCFFFFLLCFIRVFLSFFFFFYSSVFFVSSHQAATRLTTPRYFYTAVYMYIEYIYTYKSGVDECGCGATGAVEEEEKDEEEMAVEEVEVVTVVAMIVPTIKQG